jgi:LPXTG-motif cell wall-anchored protein
MADRLNVRVPAAFLLVIGLLLAIAMPVAAAPQAPAGGSTVRAGLAAGVCGTVTEFTAPSVKSDGSITFNGVTTPIAAGTTVAGTLAAALDVASDAAPVVACLSLTTTGGEITSIAVATSAQLCGAVTATGEGAARVFTIGGVVVPALATADAALTAILNAAVAAGAEVCVDVTADANTGAITVVANVDATFELCGQVVASGGAYVIEGVTIDAAQLSAAELAALQLAIANNANACVDLEIVDTTVVSATVRVDVCVTASAVSATSVTLDGVAIPLGEGADVAAEVRAGATLGISLTVDATTGAVIIARITLEGCTESDEQGGGGAAPLPDTSTGAPTSALTAVGLLALAGAGMAAARRREDHVA